MFRLSLMARTRPGLLEIMEGGASAPIPLRNEFLIERFRRRIDFIHRMNAFAYVPIETLDGTIIVGRLGRPETELAADAPERGYAPVAIPLNRAVNLFLNTSSDPEGQKLAMQVDQRVGTPSALLQSMFQYINDSDPDAPWMIDIRPITDENSFWDAVSQHENEITNVTFKMVAPNILGFTDSVSEELKTTRDENNANLITVSLDNKAGLRLRTPSIVNAVRYVAAGGGRVILRGKFKKFFDSKRKQRSISVQDDAAASTGIPETLRRIKDRLFGP